MKKFTLISASLLLALSGCTCGHGWQPNIFTRLHNRIHGVSNVGEPCDVGCQQEVAAPGCSTCGNTASQYGAYEGEVIGTYPSSMTISPAPSTYAVPANRGEPVRANPN